MNIMNGNEWYEVTLDVVGQNELGEVKKTKEKHLLKATGYTEAEAGICDVVDMSVKNATVSNIKKLNVTDVFDYEDTLKCYKAKIQFATESENGKVKKVSNNIVLNADSIKDAVERLDNENKNVLVPTEITSLTEYDITDIHN